MDFTLMLTQLAEGMVVTLEIFFLTLIFSLPLGLVATFGRMSSNGLIRNITKLYISVMRGTPLMLQLFVVFYAPFYLFKIPLSSEWRFIACIVAFVINYAAYFAEIFRAGIESIPKGQYEAAHVLGYSKGQTFFKIILPQMVKRVLPPVTNEMITLVKDTSLAFSINIMEMFTTAKEIASGQKNIMALVAAGVFYFVFNFLVAAVMERVEKKLAYYR
ncbi:MAG: amino acid ABC transporter permease [Clostridiales bacterium]|nr:amino acid ABC transporter permease [Clostridiales bacterium]